MKQGDIPIGHELKIKVTKNKLAPPFRTAHATLIYGKGVPRAMAVLDMALDMNVVKRKGSWIAFKGESLAQGKEQTMEKLIASPELMAEIEREVMAKVLEANGLVGEEDLSGGEEEKIFSLDDAGESLLEEGAIALDLDAPFQEE